MKMPPHPVRSPALRRSLQACFWLLLLLVTGLSLWPGNAGPPTSLWSDKVNHCLAWCTLGSCFAIGWSNVSAKWQWRAYGGLLAYSGALELLQGLPVIGRNPSILDLVANASGLGLAICLFLLLAKTGQFVPTKMEK